MKILFVSNAAGPDYMADIIFHGGKSLFGNNFFETNKNWYMYDTVVDKKSLYGRGFTLYGKLSENLYSEMPAPVEELIGCKFFDKIIYGSIRRCSNYFNIVNKVYNKKDIIVVDGEDSPDIDYSFVNNATYFKREYVEHVPSVYPINFAIPKNLIVSNLKEKIKLISDIIPNNKYSYSYSEEESYYQEYASSWFAHTFKKAGWDCLRHYEIMMNGCVPLFQGLENCPAYTLTRLPKKELILFSNSLDFSLEKSQFILDYTKNNLTTEHIFSYILQ
jgi:hypothetical protein